MKHKSCIIFIVWMHFLFLPNSVFAQQEAPVAIISDVKATVTFIANQYTLVPDDDNSQRYMPRNLEEQFKEDGLKVIISGKVFAIPPNVRMIGTPFEITKITLQNTQNETVSPVNNKEGGDKPNFNNENQPADVSVTNRTDYVEVGYTTKLSNIKGTIILIGNTFLIETDKGMRYYPMNLSPEFKVEKQKVIFNGMSGSPPPNVKMKGHPLKITKMEKIAPKKWWQFWK